MTQDQTQLAPLELWLKGRAENQSLFPQGGGNYFNRYLQIKEYLEKNVYKWIGAGTSAEDQGIYTDHGIDHFNAVIKSAGELLGINLPQNNKDDDQAIKLNPYEVYILLVSILLHDAGNIEGRRNHEKRAFQILKNMGDAVCPDDFEARPIAKIAEVHGGKVKGANGIETRDTIRNSNLYEETSYYSIKFRPQLIAALVRFSDEICEDRSRAATFLLKNGQLPPESEIYHSYANSISSVDVDLKSKFVSVKYELEKKDVMKRKGKNGSTQYLIDEIIERLEKMYCELCYCKPFMSEIISINQVRATVSIYDGADEIDTESFELLENGYPSLPFLFKNAYPDWSGVKIEKKIKNLGIDET